MKRLNWVDIVIIVILVGALAFVGIRAIAKNIEENKPKPTSPTETAEPGETSENESTTETEAEIENPLSEPTLSMIVEIYDITRELADNTIASFDGEPRELEGDMIPMTRIYNSNKLVDAQVVSWEILDSETESTSATDGETAPQTESRDLVTLRITIEANPDVYSCNYGVGTQEVRIGKEFIVKTMSMELVGTIVSMTELGAGPGAELDND